MKQPVHSQKNSILTGGFGYNAVQIVITLPKVIEGQQGQLIMCPKF